MAGNRRLAALLGILAVVLAAALYINLPSAPAAGGGTVGGGPRSGAPAAADTPAAPDVRTEALDLERPKPTTFERDLFRFKPKYVPAPVPRAVQQQPPPAMPSGPPPPPPIPPIGLKFIGLLEPAAGGRIAILSDGRGAPIYGREGEALLGQYRLVRIGADSVEIEYLDGRGRQAIRLSGS